MPYRSRWVLGVGILVLGIATSLYYVWHAAERAPSTLPDGIDWVATLESIPNEGFERPSESWRLNLPTDHGAHPGTRTETWLLGMHLRSAEGESVGVQLALSRVALVSPDAPKRESAWATREVYRGHVVLVTEAQWRGAGEERFSRAALGLAGHDADEQRVWLEDWSLYYGEGEHRDQLRVEARLDDTSVDIVLTPSKSAVSVGGRAPFRGFTLTRLTAEGVVRRPSGEQSVSGLAWLDHVWGEVPLPIGPVVWDRVQLHLDDGSDVSMVRTRRRDGRGNPTARGYRVDAQGDVERFEAAVTDMTPTRAWQRDSDGTRYPLYWRLSARDLDLNIEPLVEDQAHDFSVSVWSGVVVAHGRSRGRPVSGTGYLELTGYENP